MKFQVYSFIICFFIAFKTNAQDQQKNQEVRILTYNILHGANTTGDFDLDIIASVINKANPDLVALQEVDFRTARVNKRDILSELAVKTGLTSVFIKAMDFDSGEYGEGILSRTSFIKTENIRLPHSPKNEPKAAGLTTLALSSGDTIHFIGTHFDHLPEGIDRMEQAKVIGTLTKKLKYPAILAGDLNDIPGSASIRLLERTWTSSYNKHQPAPTYPSANPNVKIDYVMFYPRNKWKVNKNIVIQDSLASDHNAVLSIIELKKQKNHD